MVLAAMLAVAGCGDSQSPAAGGNSQTAASGGQSQNGSGSAGGTQTQACSLITKAEMETALGQPVNEPTPKPATTGKGSGCSYETTAQTSRGLPQLTVLVMYYPGTTSASVNDPTRTQTVSGLGDEAYYSDSGLNVFKNSNWLVISYLQVSDSTPDPRMEKAAGIAVGRM